MKSWGPTDGSPIYQYGSLMAARWSVDNRDPNSKIHVANMGPIWGRQDPGGPHVGPMIFVIWGR